MAAPPEDTVQGADDPAGEMVRVSTRLREIAAALGAPQLDDARAEELAREAADLASRAGNAVERALRDAADAH